MIEYTTGDMFDVPADARVNLVNCVGVMGKGVAAAFKSRYPELFRDYRAACRRGEVRPGGVWSWSCPSLTVHNLATKDHWQDPSRYDWVERGIANLRAVLDAGEAMTVTLPAPGCGLGGLDWARVRGMVEEHLAGVRTRVLVFEPV